MYTQTIGENPFVAASFSSFTAGRKIRFVNPIGLPAGEGEGSILERNRNTLTVDTGQGIIDVPIKLVFDGHENIPEDSQRIAVEKAARVVVPYLSSDTTPSLKSSYSSLAEAQEDERAVALYWESIRILEERLVPRCWIKFEVDGLNYGIMYSSSKFYCRRWDTNLPSLNKIIKEKRFKEDVKLVAFVTATMVGLILLLFFPHLM